MGALLHNFEVVVKQTHLAGVFGCEALQIVCEGHLEIRYLVEVNQRKRLRDVAENGLIISAKFGRGFA